MEANTDGKDTKQKGQADTLPELRLCTELCVVFSLHAAGGYL